MRTLPTLFALLGLGCLLGPTAVTGQGKGPPKAAAPLDPVKSYPLPQAVHVCVAPVIGPPVALSQRVERGIGKRLAATGHGFDATCSESSYRLRTYVLASLETEGIKVDYIIDVSVTDVSAGAQVERRVGRASGDEMLPGAQFKDPWGALTPDFAESLGERIASKLTP